MEHFSYEDTMRILFGKKWADSEARKLPDEITPTSESEVDDLPDEIGSALETRNLPDEVF